MTPTEDRRLKERLARERFRLLYRLRWRTIKQARTVAEATWLPGLDDELTQGERPKMEEK